MYNNGWPELQGNMVSDASRRYRKGVAALSLETIMGSSFKLFPVPMLDLIYFSAFFAELH